MSYNAEHRAYECIRCGPGNNRWKYSEAYCIVNEETGEIFCLVHRDFLIGNRREKEDAKQTVLENHNRKSS